MSVVARRSGEEGDKARGVRRFDRYVRQATDWPATGWRATGRVGSGACWAVSDSGFVTAREPRKKA
jgi:hypothetical protein